LILTADVRRRRTQRFIEGFGQQGAERFWAAGFRKVARLRGCWYSCPRAVSSRPARSFDRSLKHSKMMSMTLIRIAKWWWRFF
jgi:hypothetical protein